MDDGADLLLSLDAFLGEHRRSLHRVDDFLRDTKEHVSEALRAGQEAIRPAAAVRKA